MSESTPSPLPRHPLAAVHEALCAPFPGGEPLSVPALCARFDAVAGPGCWFVHTYLQDADAGIVAVSLTVFGIQMTGIGGGRSESESVHDAFAEAFRTAAALFGVGRGRPSAAPAVPPHAEATKPYTPAPVERPPTNGNARVMARPESSGQSQGQQRPELSATDAQLKAIYAIARGARGWEPDDVREETSGQYGVAPSDLTRRQASQFIDWLKAGG